MKCLYLTIAILLISFLSCKPEKADIIPVTTTEPIDVSGPAIQLSAFPLNPGNLWIYEDGDTIRVIGDTTINGVGATKLTKNNSRYSFDFYCINRPDGLYMLAATSSIAFNSLSFSASENSTALNVLDTPVQLTKLPVVISDEWSARTPYQKRSTRRWEKYATVICPVGSFNCVKTASSNIYEYYSDKGIAQFVIQPACIQAPCPPTVIKLVYVNF